MGLETGTYISDLVSTNPEPTDKRRQGDDHLRLIKSVLKSSFPTINAPITATVSEINYLSGLTSSIQSQLDSKIESTLGAGNGLTENSGELNVGAGEGIEVAADSVKLNIAGLTELNGSDLVSGDKILVYDNSASVHKIVSYEKLGIPIVTKTANYTFVDGDMNKYFQCNHASTPITLTLNTGVGQKGNIIMIEQGLAAQVTVAGSATISYSIGLKTRTTRSRISLVCTSDNNWTLGGDASA